MIKLNLWAVCSVSGLGSIITAANLPVEVALLRPKDESRRVCSRS
jgi:hypothetical protein